MEEVAIESLEAASQEFHGDPRRTYLTGLSMGGYGSWHLATKYPGRFAALVVICGGVRTPEALLKRYPELAKMALPDSPKTYADVAAKIGKTPVWIFHGADDPVVPATESRRMNAALKALAADVHYTEYPGVAHESWNKAYAEPQLFTWLFSKSLASSAK
jgi:predicted peptidase